MRIPQADHRRAQRKVLRTRRAAARTPVAFLNKEDSAVKKLCVLLQGILVIYMYIKIIAFCKEGEVENKGRCNAKEERNIAVDVG